jgi:phospho-N-acetylmuramoyl-pentapeptide-transferase
MLYYLFDYLKTEFDFPGARLFQYISFRASMAIVLSLLIGAFLGKTFISILKKLQVGESIRDLGLEGQLQKNGTPTMGGIIIIAAIVIPTLLFAKILNVYIILMLVTVVWLAFIGFLDDYIKVFKKNKAGLAGKFKVMGQVTLGVIVSLVLAFDDDVVIRQYILGNGLKSTTQFSPHFEEVKSFITTIPFVKNNEFDYCKLLEWINLCPEYTWIVYSLISIFIITAVSNGANITDGIDGLAAGISAIIGLTIAILAYVSGNAIFADYLNIMFIPHTGELVIFCAAFVGACIGFLWYNTYPAQVFMGDTGSLSLGGTIAVLALIIRKELLIPILCGIFLIENLSVIIQVAYFKYTKKKYGEGKRIFKMAPLHHHYQKLGYAEPKIVTRFWIVGILLAVLTLLTLKVR